jgi:uncharacterized membrane protein
MLSLIRLEYGRYGGDSALEPRESLRHELGCQLLLGLVLLGLEFLVAADVVHTILAPSLHELAVLGGIVAILTAISFSMNWELRQFHRKELLQH